MTQLFQLLPASSFTMRKLILQIAGAFITSNKNQVLSRAIPRYRLLTQHLRRAAGFAKLISALFLFGNVSAAFAQELEAKGRIIFPYPGAGAQIGQGWDSFGERGTTGFCVSVEGQRLEHTSFESHVEQIQSTYSLIKKVTSSISAAYSGGSFGGSASASSEKELRIDSDDQNFLFTFESSSGSTFAVPPGTYSSKIALTGDDNTVLQSVRSPVGEEKFLNYLGNAPLTIKPGFLKFSDDANEAHRPI